MSNVTIDWLYRRNIDRLRALWGQGLSAAAIGQTMGVSKNAVVGKAHRLGLPSRPSPIRRRDPNAPPVPPPVRALSAPKVTLPSLSAPSPVTPAVMAPSPAVTAAAAVLVVPRYQRRCAYPMWPDGETGAPHYPTCDAPVIGKGSGSYCIWHHACTRQQAKPLLLPARVIADGYTALPQDSTP